MLSRRAALATAGALLAGGCATPARRDGSGTSASPLELSTLRKLDDHPLWTLRYTRRYDRLRGIATPKPESPFGCSLFVAYGNRTDPVFARNFDWDHHPAMLLFTDPPDGYSSVSMVDLSYLGITSAASLDTEAGRRDLRHAPLLPFDGMNSRGLAIGIAAVPEPEPARRPGRPTAGSVRIDRIVLDTCATVAEALRVFETYDIDFDGGPVLHYLVADRNGDTAIVEYVDGKLRTTRGRDKWSIAVNFTMAGSTPEQRRGDRRYRTTDAELRRSNGALTWRPALGLLERVAQPHTQWSIVYGLESGDVHLVSGKRWHRVHHFSLRR